MSALTRCDGCGCERALAARASRPWYFSRRPARGQTEAQAQYVQRDICSDECLANYAQKRIADRAERKAREASTGADVTTLPAGSAERAVS